MQYDLVRLVLVTRVQPDFFEPTGPRGDRMTREEWLTSMFGAEIEFSHRHQEFHYVPNKEETVAPFIFGKIGRRHPVVENNPPEQGFEEVIRLPWAASDVIIDPRHHDDGQKIAFEVNSSVGNGIAICQSLAAEINKIQATPYYIEANGISDPQTFWNFEESNRGSVVSVTFELVAPNMFGIKTDLDKEMRELRENEKIHKASIKLQSEDGLNLDTSRVHESVLRGGGSIKAVTKNKKTYSSARKVKRITVDSKKSIDKEHKEPILERIKRVISKVFSDE